MKTLKLTCIFAALLIAANAAAQIPVQMESFSVNDVTLTKSAFKHAEDMDIRYLLAIDPDRLLAPYLKEAGLEPKAENYTNWENTGLDGHIGGHYLSALSYMYASTRHPEIKGRLDYFISELKRCADASGDGYLSGVSNGRRVWKEISEGDIRASSFGLNDGWVPLYNIHKIFAGLRDAYLLYGSEDCKEMFIGLTDWMYRLTSNLTDDQLQGMLSSEHGGLNEVFADAAAISGDKRFRDLAKRFSHKKVLEPLLKGEDHLTGMHANTQIPKVIGYKRIADLEGYNDWDKAAKYFWETVVDNRSITIGGNSVREHFHPADDFSSMLESEQGPETCNTYNMLRLTKMLYETSADTHYMDYYERAVYNHILSTVNPVQGGFVYFTPMRSGHYRVYSQPQTSFWCCVGSGMENHARYGEMIYSHKGDDELIVNLFIPSVLNWGKTTVEQTNDFPAEEATTLTITPEKARKFTVSIRIPEWTDGMAVTVNGKDAKAVNEGGFMKVTRKWSAGDKIEVALPMSLRAVPLPDNSDNFSFMYGPVVLAAEIGRQEQLGMYADDSRGGHIAAGKQLPLQDMPVIVGNADSVLSNISKVEGKPLTFHLEGTAPARYADGMTLVPFSTLHECRYMVYWPVVSEDEWQARLARQEADEKARLALEMITADKVICGEQQPESDHFIQMENTANGADNNGRHWRMVRRDGWFSYRLNSAGQRVKEVCFSFTGREGAEAAVEINGREIGTVKTSVQGTAESYSVPVPEDLRNEAALTVKVKSGAGRMSPQFFEVRLIKE